MLWVLRLHFNTSIDQPTLIYSNICVCIQVGIYEIRLRGDCNLIINSETECILLIHIQKWTIYTPYTCRYPLYVVWVVENLWAFELKSIEKCVQWMD